MYRIGSSVKQAQMNEDTQIVLLIMAHAPETAEIEHENVRGMEYRLNRE